MLFSRHLYHSLVNLMHEEHHDYLINSIASYLFYLYTNPKSQLGEILDPIADKILIVFILIGLSVDLDSFLIAFLGSLIIAREIGVSALRDYSSRNNNSHKTKVTYLAKIKTSVQLFTVGLYLFALAFSFNLLMIIADIFLIIATLVTLYTGYEYTLNVFKK